MVYVTECQHELPLSSQVFANTDCLRAAADAADADDISTLMADAKLGDEFGMRTRPVHGGT